MTRWVHARALLALIVASTLLTPAAAAEKSPLGLWKTFDDHTGQPRGLVRLYEEDGRFFGRIERTLAAEEADAVCAACTDERKNQPIVGLVIMRNMVRTPQSDGDATFGGGDILDPETGTVFQCQFKLDPNGIRMVVRGYIGIVWLGRSQVWLRADGPDGISRNSSQ